MTKRKQHTPEFKPAESIISRIYMIRGQKVMLDHDLAALYGVETKVLNQAVKRNIDHFPEEFMFRLTTREWILIRPTIQIIQPQLIENEEITNMRSQFVTSSSEVPESQLITRVQQKRKLTATPYAFTEYGVGMVANFLKTERALQMSFTIVKTFIHLRKYNLNFIELEKQLVLLKDRIGEHDAQLNGIYNAIEKLLDNKTDNEAIKNRRRIGFKPDS